MAVKKSNKLKKPGKAAKGTVRQARPKRGPTIGVFLDLDNTNASFDNVLEIFSSLKYKGEIVFGKLYGYTDSKADEFEEFIAEHRLDTIGRMRFKVEGTSVLDPRLVIDCISFAEKNSADMVFVWAGVGDLIPLFSQVVKAGCKTITVDLPDFDCDNKFVDEKIKLFSPHSLDMQPAEMSRAKTPAIPDDGENVEDFEDYNAPAADSIDSSLFSDRKVPQLPRKKGAPEFGAKSESRFADSYDDENYSDQDNEEDYYDDFEDEDFDIDDEDEEDEEEGEAYDNDDGRDVLNVYENLKAQEYAKELYLVVKSGQSIDKFIEKLERIEREKQGKGQAKMPQQPTNTKTSVENARTVNETKTSGLKKTGGSSAEKSISYDNAYDVEDNAKKPEEKKFEDFKSDFSDFGDL